jgi:hypothetical protein
MPFPTELTPQERLAISRKALVRHMNRHHQTHENENPFDVGSDEPLSGPAAGGTWNILKYALRLWWHNHPASAVVELAHPLLEDYAQAHPFKLLGFSAVAGAAIVVVQPWRMISAGALLAALKSSGLYGALLKNPAPQPPDRRPNMLK